MNRHAYLILVHTNPCQIRNLLKCLDNQYNDIYVHIDGNSAIMPSDLEGVCSKSPVTFVPSVSVRWGGVSILRAELNLLSVATQIPHLYYHLISGQDMPIKSQNFIHKFFEEHTGLEFVESNVPTAHTLRRVIYPTLFPEGSGRFYTNLLNHIGKFVCKVLGMKINTQVQFYQGSQWFSITHNFATFIVEHHQWMEQVFTRTTLCDEFLIPTLLQMSPYHSNRVDDNLRLIEMGRGKSMRHPWTYLVTDREMLMQSSKLWARKFDETVDNEIILELVASYS